jgi:hypothetical protein
MLAAAFFVAFGLRAWARFHWFTAWLVGAMVMPAALWISEIIEPTGWTSVALIFGGIPAAGLAALGVLVGWLIVRRGQNDAAS